MDREGLIILERIDEVTRMCDRENPIYEHVSNFSVALYVLGYLNCPDLLSVEDLEDIDAGTILKEDFFQIDKNDIPENYNVLESNDRYLVVFGDPLIPAHFAVIANMRSKQPFFSKLKFYGSGFDSLADLKSEFLGKDGIGCNDLFYYQLKTPKAKENNAFAKIYTLKNDGNYNVLEYEFTINKKEGKLCQ